MKNVRSVMLGIMNGVLTDICSYLPSMLKESTACYNAVESAFEDRGLPFFTITLPECAKLLEFSIREGSIPVERPPYHGRYSRTDCRPVFLHGLWSRIFDEHGHVFDAPCSFSVAALREVYYFAKKWHAECDKQYRDEVVNDYIRIEDELARPRPDTWDSDVPIWSRPSGHPIWGVQNGKVDPRQDLLSGFEQPETSGDMATWALFRVLCSKLSASLGFLDVWAIRPKHGPGAVSDKGVDIVKYDFDTWPRKLDNVFPADYFSSHDFVDRTRSSAELSCKLIAVPKTQKGPRLIAAEPTAHQWIQGGIQRWLESAISRSPLGLSISFRDQEASRVLALESSESGQYATVDLSSASDRLSARLVDYVFQANTSLLDALHACRTRSVFISSDLMPDGSERTLLLRKFAAMGSACTFPVQTIVFATIGHLALMLADGTRDCSLQSLRSRAHRLRVFGDDIAIDTKAYEHLVRLLTELGLKVNVNKSFHKGLFRESCGMDAFNGVDVTPAYIHKLHNPSDPSSLESVIEASNNFYRRGWWNASDAILKTVDSEILKYLAVTPQAAGPIVLFTYGQATLPSTKRRWNRRLHRHEYLTLMLHQHERKSHGRGESALLQYFTECPDQPLIYGLIDNEPLSDWSTGQAQRPSLRIKRGWADSTAVKP